MIGTGELIVILCAALLLFGGKKLPELARGLGLGLREFKKAFHGIDEVELEVPEKKSRQPAESVVIDVEAERKGKSE